MFRRLTVVAVLIVLLMSADGAAWFSEEWSIGKAQRAYPEEKLQAEFWAETVDLFWSYKDPRRTPATRGMLYRCCSTCSYYIQLYGQKAFERYFELCVSGVGELAIEYDEWYKELPPKEAVKKARWFLGKAEDWALYMLARRLRSSDLYKWEAFPKDTGPEWDEVRSVWEPRIEAERLRELQKDRARAVE